MHADIYSSSALALLFQNRRCKYARLHLRSAAISFILLHIANLLNFFLLLGSSTGLLSLPSFDNNHTSPRRLILPDFKDGILKTFKKKTFIAPGGSKSHFQGGYIPVISEDDTDSGSISGSESQGCLPSSDKSQAGCSTKHPAYRQATILTIGVVVSFLLVALVFTTFALSFNIRTQDSAVMTSPCGSTAQEARARGCHFDVISFCWLPDACYDEELSTTFDNITTWEWFLDPNRTQPIAHEEAMTGEYTGLYVNWEYHLRHCTFMWEKLHRAVLGKGKSAIDGYIGPLAHTEHCSRMLLQNRDVGFDAINRSY